MDIDTGECEAKFFKKSKIDFATGQPTFIFNEGDECSFPESDIIKILPLPFITGITTRQKRFIFPIILDRWNIYYRNFLNIVNCNDLFLLLILSFLMFCCDT